jgi:hypothetical protein
LAETPTVGDAWAYRVRQSGPLAQVIVEKLGTRTPVRIQVRFVDPSFEGLVDWVPPARLKVPWAQAAEFAARESRWEDVRRPAEAAAPHEVDAAEICFDKLVSSDLATIEYRAEEGVVRIRDLPALAGLLGLPENQLSHELAFVEEGDVIAPWPITRVVATTVARQRPDELLRYVAQEEKKAQRDSTYGYNYGRRGESHVSAEICAEVDEENGRPVRDVLRAWCGAEAVDRREELDALRAEVVRLGALTERAITELRRAGRPREAEGLSRELGIPVEALR